MKDGVLASLVVILAITVFFYGESLLPQPLADCLKNSVRNVTPTAQKWKYQDKVLPDPLVTCLKDAVKNTTLTNGSFPEWIVMHQKNVPVPKIVVMAESKEHIKNTVSCINQYPYSTYATTRCIKSGGHDYAGYSSCDGIMIDISRMKKVSCNPGVLTSELGVDLGRFVQILEECNISLPHGDCAGVGLGGHALGGGWDMILSRKIGFLTNHIISGSIILWNGTEVSFNGTYNSDYLWMSQGGGIGDVGIVSSVSFRTHPRINHVCYYKVNLTDVDPEVQTIELKKNILKYSFNLDPEYSVSFHFQPSWEGTIQRLYSIHPDCNEEMLKNVIMKNMYWNHNPNNEFKRTDLLAARLSAYNPDLVNENDISLLDMPQWKMERQAKFFSADERYVEMTSMHFFTRSYYINIEDGEIIQNMHSLVQAHQDYPDWFAVLFFAGGNIPHQSGAVYKDGSALIRIECHWLHDGDIEYANTCAEIINDFDNLCRPLVSGKIYRPDRWKAQQFGDIAYFADEKDYVDSSNFKRKIWQGL